MNRITFYPLQIPPSSPFKRSLDKTKYEVRLAGKLLRLYLFHEKLFALLVNENSSSPFFQTERPVEFIADGDDKPKGTRRRETSESEIN